MDEYGKHSILSSAFLPSRDLGFGDYARKKIDMKERFIKFAAWFEDTVGEN